MGSLHMGIDIIITPPSPGRFSADLPSLLEHAAEYGGRRPCVQPTTPWWRSPLTAEPTGEPTAGREALAR